MFIDAQDEKWSIHKIKNVSHMKPLSVCFMDENGNSFLTRVKECIGKSVYVALAIPFECIVEREDKEHDKRKGFLMVNDYVGMMYGYGLLDKLNQDFIPLLTKKDLRLLRKKGILCFLDYGSIYMELERNIWLDKGLMGRGASASFLHKFCKNPRRFLYDFHNRRPSYKTIEEQSNENNGNEIYKKIWPEKCVEVLEKLKQENIQFQLEMPKEPYYLRMACEIRISEKESRKAYEVLRHGLYIKKAICEEGHHECWVLERVPVMVREEQIFLESWQCEWLQIPYIKILKTP
ncbi:hypothetical protein CN918_26990 [Priestia megaterium]|nr:hypothetical protein CN918_26990 [Priestia megaterium]